MGRTFKGRPITKETLAVGVAGSIYREGWAPEAGSFVTFQVTGRVSGINHLLNAAGEVEERYTLTLDPETFEVIRETAAPVQPTLDATDEPEGDG